MKTIISGLALSTCLLFNSAILYSVPADSPSNSNGDLSIVQNPLDSLKNRKDALDRLLVAPTDEIYQTMISILKNEKETIPMKNIVTEAFIQKHDRFVMKEIERIAFSKIDGDLLARELSLAILWRGSTEEEKKDLSDEFLRLSQDQREDEDLRRIAIEYLGKSKIVFERHADWAEKIAKNKKESVPVRTAALNYMEYLELDSLTPIMSQIIKNPAESQSIREITILKAARLQIDSLKPDLESILMNQKDLFEIRKMCLNMLVYYGFSINETTFLKQMLAKEKKGKMKELLQTTLDKLKEQQ